MFLGLCTLFFFHSIHLFFIYFTASQTTECSNYTVINDADRSVYHVGDTVKCDDQLEEKWYRFVGVAGERIPESIPKEKHCGTHAPGWLNGRHPTQEEGKVQRVVCFAWANTTCFRKSNIKVLNCHGFFVYKLKRLSYCKSRYCVEQAKGRFESSSKV